MKRLRTKRKSQTANTTGRLPAQMGQPVWASASCVARRLSFATPYPAPAGTGRARRAEGPARRAAAKRAPEGPERLACHILASTRHPRRRGEGPPQRTEPPHEPNGRDTRPAVLTTPALPLPAFARFTMPPPNSEHSPHLLFAATAGSRVASTDTVKHRLTAAVSDALRSFRVR